PATIDDLVQRERETGERYELYRGELFAMAGGRIGHALLSTNLARELGNALKDRDCLVLGSDARVLVPATAESEADLYTFPDVSVVCGTPDLVPPVDTLRNPSLLAEVVSPSSEAYDRGQKFAFYRRLESLRTYLVLSPDRRAIDVFERSDDGLWRLRDIDGDAVVLERLGVTLSMDALYDKVPLDPDAPLHPPAEDASGEA
ncbi:MAG: Uma2 family endonuclease, partial [Bacteroidota bacterium]